MMGKCSWGPTAAKKRGMIDFSRGLTKRVQGSLDKMFGPSKDYYGQWKPIARKRWIPKGVAR